MPSPFKLIRGGRYDEPRPTRRKREPLHTRWLHMEDWIAEKAKAGINVLDVYNRPKPVSGDGSSIFDYLEKK